MLDNFFEQLTRGCYMSATISNNVAQMFRKAEPAPLQHRINNDAMSNKTEVKTPTEKTNTSAQETLQQLYRNLYQAANNKSTDINPQKMAQLYHALSPQEAQLLAQLGPKNSQGFLSEEVKQGQTVSQEETKDSKPETKTFYNQSKEYSAQTQMQQANQSVKQMQSQTQKLIASMIGENNHSNDIVKILGPNACFEDVLMHVMMKIAKQEEKNVMNKMRSLETGQAGIPGVINQGAKQLGAVAGGAVGGLLGGYMGGVTGGATGAAVGQDLGQRVMGVYGYDNSPESRQIQFETLKHMMQKQSELMSCISNILTTIHQTNKNAIGNLRG